nr:transmembrane protein 64-like [Cherax quadricarinatus]
MAAEVISPDKLLEKSSMELRGVQTYPGEELNGAEVVRRRVVRSRLVRSLLAVLGGPQAFKVVLVTRLTPIPFGLQNAVFAGNLSGKGRYMMWTVLGLLPTQVLNCYLGTTVRNLDDVVSQSASASVTGWGVFAVQIAISIGLMTWVVRRAKTELHKTVNAQLSDTQPTLASPTHTSTPTSSPTTPTHTTSVTSNDNLQVAGWSSSLGIMKIPTRHGRGGALALGTNEIHPVMVVVEL